jgi:hypothetical protein
MSLSLSFENYHLRPLFVLFTLSFPFLAIFSSKLMTNKTRDLKHFSLKKKNRNFMLCFFRSGSGFLRSRALQYGSQTKIEF